MLSTVETTEYFYDRQNATGGADDPFCRACQGAFNKDQPMIRISFTPIPPDTQPTSDQDIEAYSESCWLRTRVNNGDYHDYRYDELPEVAYADCGHPVMPRGELPGHVTLPTRRGTMCHQCADNLERAALADLLTQDYEAYRNGDSILTAQGGKLATVTTVTTAEYTDPGHALWITGLTGRVWTAPVPDPAYNGPVTLHAYPDGEIPPHVPMPPLNHHTVFPGDKVVVRYNDYAVTVLATTPENLTIGYGRSVNNATDTLSWAQVRRPDDRRCCIGLPHLCRCINRVGECLMPGCNGRATAVVDRVSTWVDEGGARHHDVYPEKVCPGHYDRLIVRPGWSVPARAA